MPTDRINYVKRELKNHNFYKQEIERLKGRLEELEHELTNIGSQGFAVVPENNDNNVSHKDTVINQKIFDTEEKIATYEQRVQAINYFLLQCDEDIRKAMIRIYMQGYSFDYISQQMYLSPMGLSYRIDKQICDIYD